MRCALSGMRAGGRGGGFGLARAYGGEAVRPRRPLDDAGDVEVDRGHEDDLMIGVSTRAPVGTAMPLVGNTGKVP